MNYSHRLAVLAMAAAAIIGAGCAKKPIASQAPNTTPPTRAAEPAAPVAQTATRPAPTPAPQAAAQPPVASRTPDAQTRARIDTLLGRISDAYFDYDQHTLRADAIQALQKDSTELRDILKDYPDYKLTIEGHCDERGSAEYNMALGQKRADAAKNYLVQVGIPEGQLGTVTYGKARPDCDSHDEGCWQRNRRVHIVADSQR